MKLLVVEAQRLGGRGNVSLSRADDRPLDLQPPDLGGKGS